MPGALLDLGGGALTLASRGRFDGTTMLGTIANGAVTATGAALAAGSLALDGVTWRGALAPMGGSLSLLNGTQVLAADGSGGQLDATRLNGPLTIAGGLDRVAVALGGGRLQAGSTGLQLGSASALSLGAGATAAGTVTDAGSVALSGGAAAFTGSFSATGSIAVTGGTLAAANLVNAGTITLDGGSALQLAGPAVLGGTVAFGTRANKLSFGAAGYDGATLQGFRNGDAVDLGGLAYDPALSLALQGNVLQVLRGTTAVAGFTLQGGTYGAGQFSLATDGAGGTLLTTQFGPQPPDSAGPGTDFDRAWYCAAPGRRRRRPRPAHPLSHDRLDVRLRSEPQLQHHVLPRPEPRRRPGRRQSAHPLRAVRLEGRARPERAIQQPQLSRDEPRRCERRHRPATALSHLRPVRGPPAHRRDGRREWPTGPARCRRLVPRPAPDAAASDLDPTRYYNTVGWRLGENPNPWFDTKYYLTANPDVAHAGVNPLQHFESFGFKEGRQPSLAFNDRAYLAANPDVAAANINPLLHYAKFGQSEGRMTFVAGPAATALRTRSWTAPTTSASSLDRPRERRRSGQLRPARLEAGPQPGPVV